jgi:hypothetical protein
MPELVKEFEYRVEVGAMDAVGAGPQGNRLVVTVPGGEAVGDRIKGAFTGAAGDWALVGEDGYARLDVRATLRTVDGALILFQFYGLLEMTQSIQDILGGAQTSTDYGDQYYYVNPRLETGDERYAWVNRTMFVGRGRLVAGPAAEFEVYRLAD